GAVEVRPDATRIHDGEVRDTQDARGLRRSELRVRDQVAQCGLGVAHRTAVEVGAVDVSGLLAHHHAAGDGGPVLPVLDDRGDLRVTRALTQHGDVRGPVARGGAVDVMRLRVDR